MPRVEVRWPPQLFQCWIWNIQIKYWKTILAMRRPTTQESSEHIQRPSKGCWIDYIVGLRKIYINPKIVKFEGFVHAFGHYRDKYNSRDKDTETQCMHLGIIIYHLKTYTCLIMGIWWHCIQTPFFSISRLWTKV